MFWSKSAKPPAPLDSDEQLEARVREALQSPDETTVKVVTAIAGLLSAVAYADREIGPEEERHLRSALERLHDFRKENVDAVAEVLRRDARRLSTSFVPRFARTLRDELPLEGRAEVLEALVEMAAADGVITHDEVVSLRNMSTALGLSQEHYNRVQAQHRDKLASLGPKTAPPRAPSDSTTEAKPPRSDASHPILQYEDALVRAQLAGNVSELDRLLDDELHFVGLGGALLSKADDLAAHRSGVIRITKMACLERHIVPLGTVAVVSVLMDTEATVGGVPNAGQLRYTRVWQEKPDGWKLVAGHMSAV
jgi:uncharacterized tellurite resistance protein B-like protein